MAAGCAGPPTGGRTNDQGGSTASTAADRPLRGVDLWIGGRLVGANGSAVVLDTGGKRISLNTTHAVFFTATGGHQEWTSVDTWAHEETGGMDPSVLVADPGTIVETG